MNMNERPQLTDRIGFILALILSVTALAVVACTSTPASPSETLPIDSASPTAKQTPGTTRPTSSATPSIGSVIVEAPIESVEVVVAELFPPQYFLRDS